MDDIHKDVLQSQLTYLQNNLNTTKVIDYLYGVKILHDDDVQRLQAEVVESARVRNLVLIIRRRGPNAFPSLIMALDEIAQHHIKTKLLDEAKQMLDEKTLCGA